MYMIKTQSLWFRLKWYCKLNNTLIKSRKQFLLMYPCLTKLIRVEIYIYKSTKITPQCQLLSTYVLRFSSIHLSFNLPSWQASFKIWMLDFPLTHFPCLSSPVLCSIYFLFILPIWNKEWSHSPSFNYFPPWSCSKYHM